MNEQSRLQWRCRRGTAEMDIMFENFLLQAYPLLNEDEKTAFELFLNESDPDIMDWIKGKTSPAQPGYEGLIQYFQGLDFSGT